VCCGTERENTVSCPFECQYLREARSREREPDLDIRDFAHPEVKIDESFLRENEPLLIFTAAGLAKAALGTEGAIDSDVREALDASVSTYLTLKSGLVYEARPTNPIAARIQSALKERIRQIEAVLRENGSVLRDDDLLRVLVFLQRLEKQKNNGRRKGRAYIDFLREFFPPEPEQAQETSLILP
jgi:hypothetical protein